MSPAQLLEEAARLKLLDGRQLEAARALPAADERSLAGELVERGWLTTYQVRQLLHGDGDELLLGSYVLLDRLGEGGMGAVYRARNWKLGRVVALKVIRPEKLHSSHIVERFLREIRAAAALDHPNIVHAHDAEQANGTWFLAMEYVEGVDLSRLVQQRGALPIEEASAYIREAALGLHHAFERGLVHRDIKPSNLLLARSASEGERDSSLALRTSHVKLLDFGLARLHEDGQTTLTQEGTLMGSADYIAPEQAEQAHHVDIRADLYSLGCTFYFLLAGQPPYPGGTFLQKVRRHQNQEPVPLEQLRPDIPEPTAGIVQRLMAKEPADRFQTPAELIAALDAASGRQEPLTEIIKTGVSRPPLTVPFWQRRELLIPAAVSLVALLAWLLWPRPDPPSSPPEKPRPPKPSPSLAALNRGLIPDSERFHWQPRELVAVLGSHRQRHWGVPHALSVSADGKVLASGGTDFVVRVWEPDTLQERFFLRCDSTTVAAVAVSPSGKTIVAGDQNGLYFWDYPKETPSHRVGVGAASLAFPADGTVVAVGTGMAVEIWAVPDPGKTPKFTLRGPDSPVTSVVFSRDGRRLAAATKGGKVHVWKGDGKEFSADRVLTLDPAPQALTFTPEGTILACSHPKGVALWDLTGPASSDPVVLPFHGAGKMVTNLAYSRDGKQLIVGGNNGDLELWDSAGGFLRRVRGPALGQHRMVLLPDDRTVIATHSDGTIRRYRFEDGGPGELAAVTGPLESVSALEFLGDGHSLVAGHYLMKEATWWELGESRPRVRKEIPLGKYGPTASAVTPDGKRLALAWGRIFFRDLEGDDLVPSIEPADPDSHRVYGLSLSPDGRLLATGEEKGGPYLWRLDRTPTQIPQGKDVFRQRRQQSVAFSNDGRRLAAGSIDSEIVVWTVKGEQLEDGEILKGHDNTVSSLVFSPDGNDLYSGGDYTVRRWGLHDRHRTSEVLGTLTGYVQPVAVSPDGSRVAAASNAGHLMLLHTDPRKRTPIWNRRLPGPIHRLAFSRDGKHLALGNGNGTVYILRLP